MKVFQPVKLKEDLHFLLETIEHVHPNPYAYTSKVLILQEIQEIEQIITAPLPVVDFYKLIAPLIAHLQDGHTSVSIPFHEFNKYTEHGGLVFPFDLTFRGEKAYVLVNYSGEQQFEPGTEILSLNRISMETLIRHLLRFISGERMEFRLELLKRLFRPLLWFTHYFGQHFELEIVTPTGDELKVQIAGIKEEERLARQKEMKGKTSTTYLELANLQGRRELPFSIGNPSTYAFYADIQQSLGIISFRVMEDLERFTSFLESVFQQIKDEKIQNLIIDLRNNWGGDSRLGDVLLNYLTAEPFSQFAQTEMKVSEEIRKYYLEDEHMQAYYRSSLPKVLHKMPLQRVHPVYRAIFYSEVGEIVTIPNPAQKSGFNRLRFSGNIYCLIGNQTYSSAVNLATAFKDYRIGTLIGEETGGLASHYGDIYFFQLPNTQLGVEVAHKHYLRPNSLDDRRGVIPDQVVKMTVEDEVARRDPVLLRTWRLITGQEK